MSTNRSLRHQYSRETVREFLSFLRFGDRDLPAPFSGFNEIPNYCELRYSQITCASSLGRVNPAFLNTIYEAIKKKHEKDPELPDRYIAHLKQILDAPTKPEEDNLLALAKTTLVSMGVPAEEMSSVMRSPNQKKALLAFCNAAAVCVTAGVSPKVLAPLADPQNMSRATLALAHLVK
jgi:hypothetical protein